jgi:beta-galactosidase/beta-glucuronidase
MHADPHPRPQLTRERWVDLSGPWGFTYDDADEGLDAGWQDSAKPFERTIQVPFPPESPASGIADTSFHPVLWYRRAFQAPHRAGERLLLHFGAVDYRACVWVDGHLVATHEGGHTPFHADITTALDDDLDEHVITVRAEDPPVDPSQPRGKQDWLLEPHAIWYERTSGIWQTVWLEPVPAVRITQLCWTPDVERGVLRVCATVTGPSAAVSTGDTAGPGRLRPPFS